LEIETLRPVSDSRVPSLVSEFYNCLVGQKISGLLKNPKLHYHIYISQQQYPILNQTNAIYVIPSHFFKTHFNLSRNFVPVASLTQYRTDK